MEATANWASHRVEFWVGGITYTDYFDELGKFLAQSSERFDKGDTVLKPGGPEYGAFIVAEFLEEQLGPDSIRQSWERLSGTSPPTPGQVIQELVKVDSIYSFADEIDRFRQWAYVLDANDSPVGFGDTDAHLWWDRVVQRGWEPPQDTLTLGEVTSPLPQQYAGRVASMEQTGARYLRIQSPQRYEADLTVMYDSDNAAMRATVIKLGPDGKPNRTCSTPDPLYRGEPFTFSISATCPSAVVVYVYATEITESGSGSGSPSASVDWTIEATHQSTVLTNGTVDLSIGAYGNIYSPTGIGLRFDGRPDTESVINGCDCEGWGIAAAGDSGGSATETGGTSGLSLKNFWLEGSLARSVVAGPDGLEVTHVVYPSGNPYLMLLQVIVANTGTQTASAVRYRRVVEWDPLPDGFDAYTTVAPLAGDTSYLTGITNDGFADPNPALPLTDQGANGWFTDFGPADTGALIEITLGDIAPGTSKMFSLYYGLAPSEAAAIAAAQAVGAQAYSLGEVATNAGRDQGLPYTAVMAIDGSALTGGPGGPHVHGGLTGDPGARHATLGPSVPGVRRQE